MARPDVVVVGASAGGFGAVRALLRSLPPRFPAAVFIVIHRGPKGPALLPSLLAGETPLPIRVPTQPEKIRAGRIYLAPLDRHLVLEDSRVRATRGRRQHGFRPSVDLLFTSAATTHGRSVTGVVLSGGLDDGTAGLLAIKRSGGTAIVQDPEEAPVPGMPLSALQNVKVDAVLCAAEIGPCLVALARHDHGRTRGPNVVARRCPDDARESDRRARIIRRLIEVMRGASAGNGPGRASGRSRAGGPEATRRRTPRPRRWAWDEQAAE